MAVLEQVSLALGCHLLKWQEKYSGHLYLLEGSKKRVLFLYSVK